LLLELRLRAPAVQFTNFRGDGNIRRHDDIVAWQPPAGGGKLEYGVMIDHERDSGGFDALVTDDWAVFRGDDIFPPAHIRQEAGSDGPCELALHLPAGWSAVTPFEINPYGRYVIENPERIYDRPTGWIIAGKLGVRRDTISGIKVSVAGPVGNGVQRTSMLALLRWTMPYLARELEKLPDRVSIVSANDPMWRGGLSAPKSIFIHADRPLLSENSTSTLLHEVVHVLARFPTDAQHDWIDEGIAEYINLEILRRSGTISDKRFNDTISGFRRRGKGVTNMATTNAGGAIKARAVDIFFELDREIRRLTDKRGDIFDLVRRLIREDVPADLTKLRVLSAEIVSDGNAQHIEIKSLRSTRVPGFGS
jgi:hypothetical protein